KVGRVIFGRGIFAVAECFPPEFEVFGSAQHVYLIGYTAGARVEVGAYLRFSGLALLGSDEDDAVGAARSVDCGGIGIFQYVDALDIGRVDAAQWTLSAVVAIEHIQRFGEIWNAVDDIKRIVCVSQ